MDKIALVEELNKLVSYKKFPPVSQFAPVEGYVRQDPSALYESEKTNAYYCHLGDEQISITVVRSPSHLDPEEDLIEVMVASRVVGENQWWDILRREFEFLRLEIDYRNGFKSLPELLITIKKEALSICHPIPNDRAVSLSFTIDD